MIEFEKSRTQQVLKDIHRSYSTESSYELLQTPPDTKITPTLFANDRIEKMYHLITMPGWNSLSKGPDSFFSEWIVMLGLQKSLEKTPLKVKLAPCYLETGQGSRKGVDIVISKENKLTKKHRPTFAINVKLQNIRNARRDEVYKYDQVLGCPSIELSLGDFNIQTKKSGNVSIVPWLRNVAVPNITSSGQIPNFNKWQLYLTKKISETISHYMIKTDDYLRGGYTPPPEENNIFPNKPEEFNLFYENLSFTYTTIHSIQSNQ